MTLATLGLAFGIALIAVGGVRQYAIRTALLDHPNERSSHQTATPRGGGIGLIVGILAPVLLLGGAEAANQPTVLAIAAVAWIAIVGFLDDRIGLAASTRLGAHMVAGLMLVPLVRELPPGSVDPLFVAVWWVFWTASSINVVNFIDGIDGLIGSQALVIGIHSIVQGGAVGNSSVVGAAIAGASTGFLMWNWSPARIFLGDVGSGSLGIVFVIAGALLMRQGSVSFVSAFLPLAPIFLDATVTLVRRAWRRERLSEAHRTHLYQLLANGGWGHRRVALAYAGASVVGVGIAKLWPRAGVLPLAGYLLLLGVTGVAAQRALKEDPPPLPGNRRSIRR